MQIVKAGIFPCNVLGFVKFGLRKVSLVWKEQLVKIRDETKSPLLRGSLVRRLMTKFELAAPVSDHLLSLVIQMESNEWRDWETLNVVWAGRQQVSQATWGRTIQGVSAPRWVWKEAGDSTGAKTRASLAIGHAEGWKGQVSLLMRNVRKPRFHRSP